MLEGLVYEQTKAPQVVVVRSKLSSSDANERTMKQLWIIFTRLRKVFEFLKIC